MKTNLIQAIVRSLLRFGVFILVTTPLTSLHAQNSAKAQDQSVQDQLEALRKEIADLKKNQGNAVREGAAPRIQQQGAGQNIGGTTEKESLLDDTNFDVGSRLSIVERNQEIAAEEAAKKASEAPKISFTDKGFTLRSADGQHALRLGGTLQLDDRQYIDQANDANNQFIVRRARVYASGTLWKYTDFRFMPDFGTRDSQNLQNTAIIADAWLNFKAIPEAQVQVGKFKPPLGLEMLQSDQNTVFMERSTTTQLQPSRALGVQVHGLLFDDTLSYATGVFATAPNNWTQTVDTGLGYGVYGRLFARPFVNDADELSGLGFGVAGSYVNAFDSSASTQGNDNAAVANGLNSYATDTGNTFFNWNGSSVTGNTVATAGLEGAQFLIIPQAFYYYGPWGVQAEYALQSQGLALYNSTKSFTPQTRATSFAWQTTISYNITGEDNSFDSVTPANNFDFFQTDDDSATGLWQVAFRVDQIQLDNTLFKPLPGGGTDVYLVNGNLANGAGRNARGFNSYSLGFNWYLNPNIRFYANFVYTPWYYASQNGGGSGNGVPQNNQSITNDEFGITTRVQLFF